MSGRNTGWAKHWWAIGTAIRACRGRARRAPLTLSLSMLALALGAPPALASVTPFGSEGEGAGQFNGPQAIAVDQTSGDIYIADYRNDRVDKFGPNGEFLLTWGWGVADGKEAPETCGPEASPQTTTCRAGIEGTGAGQFGGFSVYGIAVDNSLGLSQGDVYVEDLRNNRIEKFTPKGEFVLMFGGEVNKTTKGDVCLAGEECQAGVEAPEGEPVRGEFERLSARALAVGPTGTVYVGDIERVQEFTEGGVYAATISLPQKEHFIEGVAVDAAEDIFIAAEPTEQPTERGVREYNQAGEEQGQPRDPTAMGYYTKIALGPSGELFLTSESGEEQHHVLEYEPSGSEVANFIPEGVTSSLEGLAFADGSKTLYALTEHGVYPESLPAPGPQVRAGSESATDVLPTNAKLNAVVDPEGRETTVHFEYGEGEGYGASTPSQVLSGGPFDDQVAIASLSELKPRTTYHYRVVASSECEPVEHPGHICTVYGSDATFTTLPPVSIESESVSQVSSTAAVLEAELNGHSRSTEYRFEYGPSTRYGSTLPVPEGAAGAGAGVVTVTALAEHLAPDTTYHYRIVAHNAAGVSEGPDQSFTTQAATTEVTQPDGRAWEMVSPPNKQGVRLEAFGIGLGTEGGLIESSEDGSALTYISKAPIDSQPAGSRSFADTQYLATRGPGGWRTQDIATPNEAVAGVNQLSEYRYFSPSLSMSIVEPESDTALSSATSEWSPYLREPNGEYVPFVSGCPPVTEPCEPSVAEHANVPAGTKFGPHQFPGGDEAASGGVMFVTATPDFREVLLSYTSSLVKEFEAGENGALYEWREGKLQAVSILPSGASAASEGTVYAGYIKSGETPSDRHVLSDDGRRVFFGMKPGYGPVSHLYMRDVATSKTVQLDSVQPGASGGEGEAAYADASADGSKAFFMDTARLTTDSTSEPEKPDLYVCEIGEAAGEPTCRLKDLTADRNAGEAADVLGTVVGAGEDGTYVYYVANGVLANGAIKGDCGNQFGKLAEEVCNLYVTNTNTGETSFIATLSQEDSNAWEAGVFHDELDRITANVSANGRYLAFMSQGSPTGYDNRDVASGVPDQEVYEYDAVAKRLVCVSCNPTGARPAGMLDREEVEGGEGKLIVNTAPLVDNEKVWQGHWLAGSILGYLPAGSQTLYEPHYLDNNGRLFFNSPVGLVPQDANGTEDVYEFEPAGVGSCRTSTSTGTQVYVQEVAGSPVEGCVGLMSAGTSTEESAFLAASSRGPGGGEGEDVFFMTAAKLSPADLDNSMDIYDAHICSAAAPCPPPPGPVPPACTTAESCRAASPPQPAIFGAPPSQTFAGAGNVVPPTTTKVSKAPLKCTKAKRRSHGRCVKAKPKAKRRKHSKQARRARRPRLARGGRRTGRAV